MADLDVLAALYRDPEVRRYFPDGTRTYEESGAFIGRCGLLPWEIDGRTEAEMAYLLDKQHWGRGLATEAGRGIAGHAFSTVPVDRLICLVDPEDAASRKVPEKIGMTLLWDGYVDEEGPSHVYAIPRSEWQRA